MITEDLLTDDFSKQFKSRDSLNDFLGQLQKRGIERMLEGELDVHLGYDKHEQSTNSNSRNGYGKQKIRIRYGESEISVPRDRDASLNPMIVPKRANMVDGIEEVIVSLYAKEMSVSGIEEQIKDVYNFDVSASTTSCITSRISEDIVSWQNRPLEILCVRCFYSSLGFVFRESLRRCPSFQYLGNSAGAHNSGRLFFKLLHFFFQRLGFSFHGTLCLFQVLVLCFQRFYFFDQCLDRNQVYTIKISLIDRLIFELLPFHWTANG